MSHLEMYDPPHPGEVLKMLYLELLQLTVTEAALGLQVTRKTLSAFLNMLSGVSPEMALKLSKAFRTTPSIGSICNRRTIYGEPNRNRHSSCASFLRKECCARGALRKRNLGACSDRVYPTTALWLSRYSFIPIDITVLGPLNRIVTYISLQAKW